jgi:hypothetical protein
MVKSFKLLEILTWVHKREGRHTSRNISRAKDLFVFLTKKKKKKPSMLASELWERDEPKI